MPAGFGNCKFSVNCLLHLLTSNNRRVSWYYFLICLNRTINRFALLSRDNELWMRCWYFEEMQVVIYKWYIAPVEIKACRYVLMCCQWKLGVIIIYKAYLKVILRYLQQCHININKYNDTYINKMHIYICVCIYWFLCKDYHSNVIWQRNDTYTIFKQGINLVLWIDGRAYDMNAQ